MERSVGTKMGVREFRDNFTTIAREAKEPVIITNHDEVVGWFTPASKPQRSVRELLDELAEVRRSAESRGIDVAARLAELGLEDDALFENPSNDRQSRKPKGKSVSRRRK